eukprot:757743-Hanusia_phi.AAC.4
MGNETRRRDEFEGAEPRRRAACAMNNCLKFRHEAFLWLTAAASGGTAVRELGRQVATASRCLQRKRFHSSPWPTIPPQRRFSSSSGSSKGGGSAPPAYEDEDAHKSLNLSKKVVKSVCRSLDAEGGSVSRKELLVRGWSPPLLKRVLHRKEEVEVEEIRRALTSLWSSHTSVDSLLSLFNKTCELHKHRNAYGYWIVDSLYPLGTWKYITYNQVKYLATDMRDLLHEMGVRGGDSVAIISRNCAEWVAMCVAAFSLRAAVVPLDEEQEEKDWMHAILDSGCKVVFVGNEDLYTKVKEMLQTSKTHVSEIICIDGVNGFLRYKDYALTHRLRKIRDVKNRVFSQEERCQQGDIAFTFYRHSSDGTLLPFSLTHAQLVCGVFEQSLFSSFSRSDVSMSFLPWSEPTGAILELFCMMLSGGAIVVSEGRTKLRYNCQEVKPSVLFTRGDCLEIIHGSVMRDSEELVYKFTVRWALEAFEREKETSQKTSREETEESFLCWRHQRKVMVMEMLRTMRGYWGWR